MLNVGLNTEQTKLMIPKPLKSCNGFTFVAAMMIVMIMGIMLGMFSQSWTMIMKREREAELLFRGNQIVNAIAKWYTPSGGRQPMPLRDLKDLLQDPNSVSNVRYLRRLYTDPVTNKEWLLIRDPVRGGIVGVASSSEKMPVKQDFSDYPAGSLELKTFGRKQKYSEWQFDYRLITSVGPVPLPGQR